MKPTPLRIERALPSRQAWPLHDAAQTREIERRALAAVPEFTLMARAGACLARLAVALAPRGCSAWVACGPGNNGGDGLAAAAELARRGWRVHATLLPGEHPAGADATRALTLARDAGVVIDQGLPSSATADLVIDALLGLGASRAPRGELAEAIARVNGARSRCGVPVLAADLPSGLDADTGRLLGAAAVRATHTLAMLTLKPGLCTHHGRDHAGDIWLARLDCAVDDSAAHAWLTGHYDALQRQHAQHKGSFGDLRVIGGAPGMQGAAFLAARSALAAGAGRVYLSLLGQPGAAFDPGQPELMLRPFDAVAATADLAQATVVFGCGAASHAEAALPAVLHHAARLVLDADGLNAVAHSPPLRNALRARHARGRPSVLTPHPLEAARLLACPVEAVQDNRVAAARRLAEQLCCTVLLKGSGSVVAGPTSQRPVWINPTGSARLATAGTGDVLAGWLGGVWAQRPSDPPDAIAARAAHVHGRGADTACGTAPVRAADLIEQMRAATATVAGLA